MSNGKNDALDSFFKAADAIKKDKVEEYEEILESFEPKEEEIVETPVPQETPVQNTTESYLQQLRGTSGPAFSSFHSKKEVKPEGDMNQYVDRVKQASTGDIYEQDLQNTPATMKDLGNLSQQIAANIQTSLTSLGGGGVGEKDVLQLIADNVPDVELDSAQLDKVIQDLQALMLDSAEVVLKAGDTMTGDLIIDDADLKVEGDTSKIWAREVSSPYGGTNDKLTLSKSGSVRISLESGVTSITNVPARYNANAVTTAGSHPYDLIHKEYAEDLIVGTVDSAYVQARAITPPEMLDSGDVVDIITETVDSAFVNPLIDFLPEVTEIVDSAYVNTRVDGDYLPLDGGTLTGDLILDSDGGVSSNITVRGGNIRVTDGGAMAASIYNSVGNSNVSFQRNGVTGLQLVTDNVRVFKEMVYSSQPVIDNSANWTASTLVTKGYVDSAINAISTVGYTDSDFDARLATKTSDDIIEGTTNNYYTNALIDNRIKLTVDSSYVRLLQSFSAFDSDEVEAMIDSAVGEIVIPSFDSDEVEAMIDSAVGEIVIPSFDSDAVQDMIDSSISVGTNPFDQDLNTTDDVEFNKVASNLDGAIIFKAKNESGSPIAKGEAVYISGVSGNTPLVDVADASDSDKMPAFGIAMETASDNSEIEIVTFGDLAGIDTQSYTVGDTLFVDTTPGQITNVKPIGASTKIQNIAYVTKVDNTTGQIKVGGAGRSAATPNLDAGQIFYGNGIGRSIPTLLSEVVDSAYIESRIDVVSPSSVGTTVAAARFKYSSTFSYDSAGDMPGSFVKNQFGISDIARTQAGRYTVVFDSDTGALFSSGHDYVVMTTIDYNGENPTLSSRHIAVNGQTDTYFYLLAERSDNGTDGDYNDQSFVNFQVIRMN